MINQDQYAPKYFEVQYFQPADAGYGGTVTLDGLSHPDRWVYEVAIQWAQDYDERYPATLMLHPVGSQAAYPFLNDVCEDYYGQYQATIVRPIDTSEQNKISRFEND